MIHQEVNYLQILLLLELSQIWNLLHISKRCLHLLLCQRKKKRQMAIQSSILVELLQSKQIQLNLGWTVSRMFGVNKNNQKVRKRKKMNQRDQSSIHLDLLQPLNEWKLSMLQRMIRKRQWRMHCSRVSLHSRKIVMTAMRMKRRTRRSKLRLLLVRWICLAWMPLQLKLRQEIC